MQNETLSIHEPHHDSDSTDVFGFWLYIMTDCILFSCLFAVFIVLSKDIPYEIKLQKYINLNDILIETFVLLTSNLTFCFAILNLYLKKIIHVQIWLIITFILGAAFIFMEAKEFAKLATEGFRWDVSANASSFFTLVGTHGLHVSFGLFWIAVMIFQLSFLKDHQILKRRMTYLGLFWNFLDIVWIFVFTIVYLIGAI
jgi:cytochrome o ubiquinol oxidase subunit III